ncbi:MAG: hypothetical protein EU533_09400 [Promethearchaeota archaeon]|nr:MAG: hypothetical protein EU533_09400 [Candidatus Lokiarchaeota archaeon]
MFLEKPLSKKNVVNSICTKVEELGFDIEKKRVETFVDNFMNKYNRLPHHTEIKPIVLSYMRICKEEEQISEIFEKEDPNYGVLDNDIYLNTLSQTTISINKSKYDDGCVVIPKPEGRRLCPVCGPSNLYKIHEIIDKDDILCSYPRIYGKKYICDQCGIEWKEK